MGRRSRGGASAAVRAGESFAGHRLNLAVRLGGSWAATGTGTAWAVAAWTVGIGSTARPTDRPVADAIPDADRGWPAAGLAVAGVRGMHSAPERSGSSAVC